MPSRRHRQKRRAQAQQKTSDPPPKEEGPTTPPAPASTERPEQQHRESRSAGSSSSAPQGTAPPPTPAARPSKEEGPTTPPAPASTERPEQQHRESRSAGSSSSAPQGAAPPPAPAACAAPRRSSQFEQLCQEAARAYTSGKTASTLDGQKAYFEKAALSWENALGLLGAHLRAQRSSLHKNLGKTCKHLAILAAEEQWECRAHYYTKQMVGHVEHHAGQQMAAWREATQDFVSDVAEKAPNQAARLTLLGAFSGAWPPTKGRVDMEIAAIHVRAALRKVPDGDVAPALAALQSRHDSGSRRSSGPVVAQAATAEWVEVQGCVQRACQKLAAAGLPQPEWGDESGIDFIEQDEAGELVDQARFLNHRASVIIRLCQALEAQDRAMFDEEFRMQDCLEVLDMLVDALHTADRSVDAPQVLGASRVDVEMKCVCLHYLAKFYTCLHMTAQSKRKHYECVTLGLSLDGTDANSLPDLLESRSYVKGLLAAKFWFRDSVLFMQRAREERAKECIEEEAMKREAIKEPLARIAAANTGLGPLMKYLCENFPVAEGQACPGDGVDGGAVPKAAFMRFMAHYHPDKQSEDKSQERMGHDNWKNLCTEITKMLNHYYETAYKAGQPTEEARPEPEAAEAEAGDPQQAEGATGQPTEEARPEPEAAEAEAGDPQQAEGAAGQPTEEAQG